MAEDKGFAMVPKFEGFYDHWAMMMENLFHSKDYWDVVEKGVPATTATSTEEEIKAAQEAKLMDFKAKNYLFQSIERGIMETILDKNSAKAIWDSFHHQHQVGAARSGMDFAQLRRCLL